MTSNESRADSWRDRWSSTAGNVWPRFRDGITMDAYRLDIPRNLAERPRGSLAVDGKVLRDRHQRHAAADDAVRPGHELPVDQLRGGSRQLRSGSPPHRQDFSAGF